MDAMELKLNHLTDIARAQIADAADLNELSELFRAELNARAQTILALEEKQKGVLDSTEAFWAGIFIGASIAGILCALTSLARI